MTNRKPIHCPDTKETVLTYSAYLRTAHWLKFRKKALRHYGYKCSVCGTKKRLQVHHLTYKRVGQEKLEDVQIMCRFCHSMHHKIPMYPVLRRLVWLFWVGVGFLIYWKVTK